MSRKILFLNSNENSRYKETKSHLSSCSRHVVVLSKTHSLVEKSLRTWQLSTAVLISLPIMQWNILEKYEKIDKCISTKKRQVAMSINRNPRLADHRKMINYLIL